MHQYFSYILILSILISFYTVFLNFNIKTFIIISTLFLFSLFACYLSGVFDFYDLLLSDNKKIVQHIIISKILIFFSLVLIINKFIELKFNNNKINKYINNFLIIIVTFLLFFNLYIGYLL